MRCPIFQQAVAALALGAIAAHAVPNPPPHQRDLTTTIVTTSCTANATSTTVTTSTTLTTSTSLTTSTTLTTQVITKTAYVLANPPFDANQATPFATISPDAIPSPSPASPNGGGSSGWTNAYPGDAGAPAVQASSSSSEAPAAGPTLLPAQPPTINPSDMGNLKPTNSSPLSYTPSDTPTDGSVPYTFAEANATFQYPTVILPHTSFVSSMICTAAGLNVVFTEVKAYQYAKNNWKTLPFLLVTESLHCNAADDGIHVYWLVSHLDYNDDVHTIYVTAREVAVEDALHNINIIWGQYVPPNQNPGTNWTSPPATGPVTDGTTGPSTGNIGGGTNNPGATIPSNSTSIYTNSSLSCLNPPALYKGLPTAPCGPDFDIALDKKVGFYNATSLAAEFNLLFGTNLTEANFTKRADYDWTREAIAARSMGKRSFGSWFKGIVHKVGHAFEDAAKAVAKAAQDVFEKAKHAAEDAVKIVRDGLNSIGNPSFDKTVTINAVPEGTNSVFGPHSKQVYSKYSYGPFRKVVASLNVYCVDCGVTGTTRIHGGLGFSLSPPSLTKAEIGMSGGLYATVNIGAAVLGHYSAAYDATIVSFPIPGASLSIANIVTIGAAATVSAHGQIDVQATGQVLVGTQIDIPDFSATLDAVNGQTGAHGFTPQFHNKRFEASGKLQASIGFALPIELAVQLVIPSIKVDKRVGLRDTPSVTASTSIEGNADVHGAGVKMCYQFDAENVVDLDVLGKSVSLLDTKWSKIYADCISYGQTSKKRDLDGRRAIAHRSLGSQMLQYRDNSTVTIDATNTTDTNITLTGDPPVSNTSVNLTSAVDPPTIPAPINMTTTDLPPTTNDTNPTNITSIPPPDFAFNNTKFDDDLGSALNASIAGANSTDYGLNLTFSSISDSSGAFTLANTANGNLIFADVSSASHFQFASVDGVVVGAGDDLLFFVYADEMATLGVSRFRMGEFLTIPLQANVIALLPVHVPSAPKPVYVAGDLFGDIYYPVVCSITGLESKIFMVADLIAGIAILQDPNLQSVVTGGIVESCSPIALLANI